MVSGRTATRCCAPSPASPRSYRSPVTADHEAGYSAESTGVAETVRRVIAAGAVGVNLADGTGDPTRPLRPLEAQAERLAAARVAATGLELPLVITTRVDTYLAPLGEGPARVAETTLR
jgi:2-methylisocitrate lyase-like PEP mutase family enzyme